MVSAYNKLFLGCLGSLGFILGLLDGLSYELPLMQQQTLTMR